MTKCSPEMGSLLPMIMTPVFNGTQALKLVTRAPGVRYSSALAEPGLETQSYASASADSFQWAP